MGRIHFRSYGSCGFGLNRVSSHIITSRFTSHIIASHFTSHFIASHFTSHFTHAHTNSSAEEEEGAPSSQEEEEEVSSSQEGADVVWQRGQLVKKSIHQSFYILHCSPTPHHPINLRTTKLFSRLSLCYCYRPEDPRKLLQTCSPPAHMYRKVKIWERAPQAPTRAPSQSLQTDFLQHRMPIDTDADIERHRRPAR